MKKNIAVIWGGYTSEIIVSEKSMEGVYSFLDKNLYNVYTVRIDKHFWNVEVENRLYKIDKNDFSFKYGEIKINFDFAYITIHGTPGEDGRLQGYFDMLGIPYSSCGVLSSSLTMNKYICNKYLSTFGIQTAKSCLIKKGQEYNIDEIARQIGFPMFIKPNSGGSSFATSKVNELKEVVPSIEKSFEETEEVIIESFVPGKEITCGCYKTQEKTVALPLTEVVTSNIFFDYDAKYNGQVEEITPARISQEMSRCIQELTVRIYDYINAKGFIRADFIIHDDIPYLLEVNTTPGMTATSFIPQQVKAAGLNITEVFSEIIEYEYKKIRH